MPGPQTITRLSPLSAVLAAMQEIQPVPAQKFPVRETVGCVPADDVVATEHPKSATALIDGWAIASDETQDAGAYAPAPLGTPPVEVGVGDQMPTNTDAVAAFEAVKVTDNGGEISEPVTAGEGVLAPAADCAEGAVLRRRGERIRSVDVAVFESAGIEHLRLRKPRIRVAGATSNDLVRTASAFVSRDVTSQGGIFLAAGKAEDALRDNDSDAVVMVGGSGGGARDRSVAMLAEAGRVSAHGMALAPGETSAFGFVGARPVLILPGRIDAVLAGWIVLGRYLLGRLQGRTDAEPTISVTLSRKVSSTIGMADFIPVELRSGKAEPLASKYLPFSALVRAQGWILIPPESEGYPAGATIGVGLLP